VRNSAVFSAGSEANTAGTNQGKYQSFGRAFTQAVAQEVKDYGICVMSVGPRGPGATKGDDLDALPPEQVQALAGEIDLELGGKLVKLAEAPLEFTGRTVGVRDVQLALNADEVPASEGRRR
jgi:hypothetical protein